MLAATCLTMMNGCGTKMPCLCSFFGNSFDSPFSKMAKSFLLYEMTASGFMWQEMLCVDDEDTLQSSETLMFGQSF